MAVFQILATVKNPKLRSQLVNQLIRADFTVKVLGNQVRITAHNGPADRAFRAYRQIRTRVVEAANRFSARPTEQPACTAPSLREVS